MHGRVIVLVIEPMSRNYAIYRENFLGVTLPAQVNLSKCLYEKQLKPLPELKTAPAHALILSS